jgi:hypothetical protein
MDVFTKICVQATIEYFYKSNAINHGAGHEAEWKLLRGKRWGRDKLGPAFKRATYARLPKDNINKH